jgi:hypothetical protein
MGFWVAITRKGSSENGSLLGNENTLFLVINQCPDEVGGQEIRSELNALKSAVDGVGEAADRQRLRQSGHALEEHVAPAEQPHEQPVQHILLTDNNFPELGEESFDENRFLLNPLIDCLDGRFHLFIYLL